MHRRRHTSNQDSGGRASELENGNKNHDQLSSPLQAQSESTLKDKASSFTDKIMNLVIVLVFVVSFSMTLFVLNGIAVASSSNPNTNGKPEEHPFIADIYKQLHRHQQQQEIQKDNIVSAPRVPMLHNPNSDIIVHLQPIFGQHRPNSNAVLALAAGYGLNTYIQFIGSLRQTGYGGDIVLATDTFDKMSAPLKHYLQSDDHLILYHLEADCKDGRCQLKKFFYNTTNNQYRTDVRVHRPFATLRYDAYWFWSTHYNAHSKLLVVDSRDVVFQSNPFQNIQSTDKDDSGTLHFFEEKMPIYTSSFNMRWLRSAGYSQQQIDTFKDQKILCSGVSMGEQVAVEAYLQTVLLEFDKTQCINHGCDQGLHNYVYYSQTLQKHPAIHDVKVYEQGKNRYVSNLAGLRHENKPLRELGVVVDEGTVVNNEDGGSIPAIAHQVDRDKELAAYFRRRYNAEARKVTAEYQALQSKDTKKKFS